MSRNWSIESEATQEEMPSEDLAWRAFLGKAGRFAAVTPPAITLLLGTSLGSKAIAGSNGSYHPGKGPKPGKGPSRPYRGPKPHKDAKPGKGPSGDYGRRAGKH